MSTVGTQSLTDSSEHGDEITKSAFKCTNFQKTVKQFGDEDEEGSVEERDLTLHASITLQSLSSVHVSAL